MGVEDVLCRVTEWAEAEEDVVVALVTGSIARNEHDELSDLDIELYVSDPVPLLTEQAWWRTFGDVLAVEILENPGRYPRCARGTLVHACSR